MSVRAAYAVTCAAKPTFAAPLDGMTDHARTRWRDRVDPSERHPGYAIRAAWSRSVSVGYSAGGSVRYHPPTSTVLVYDGPSYAPTIVTLWCADPIRENAYTTGHLMVCGACDQLVDPTDRDRCPWCDARLGGMVTPQALSAD